jgi:hypothetical protein
MPATYSSPRLLSVVLTVTPPACDETPDTMAPGSTISVPPRFHHIAEN